MNDSTRAMSPLRQRMMEDMRLRKLAPQTQASYIRTVRRLASYLRRPPDTATVEDLRNFQLYLVDQGTSPITLNATITGLKFFFGVTLDRGALMAKMNPVFVPRTLPVVLSREEVTSLIAATRNLKHQTALSVAYGAGLRASEVAALKVGDVDSTRMTLRIQQGKGGKDRYAMLSPVMLDRLRTWWRVARAQGKMLEGGWLFPGLNPIEPLSTRQLNRAVHEAALAARIDKRVSMHTLRHSSGSGIIPATDGQRAYFRGGSRDLRWVDGGIIRGFSGRPRGDRWDDSEWRGPVLQEFWPRPAL
jgi:integrase/recombinase XerD